jgi:hypothetical protein
VLIFTSKYRTCSPVATANFGGWPAAAIHVDARAVRRARRVGNGTQSPGNGLSLAGGHGTIGHPHRDSTRESRRLQTTRHYADASMPATAQEL